MYLLNKLLNIGIYQGSSRSTHRDGSSCNCWTRKSEKGDFHGIRWKSREVSPSVCPQSQGKLSLMSFGLDSSISEVKAWNSMSARRFLVSFLQKTRVANSGVYSWQGCIWIKHIFTRLGLPVNEQSPLSICLDL